MFPFTCKKKSKYEVLRDTISERVQDALDHIPVDKLEGIKEAVTEAASHRGVTVGATVTKGAAHTLKAASDALHTLASSTEDVRGQVKEHFTTAANTASQAASTAAGTATDALTTGTKKAQDVRDFLVDATYAKRADFLQAKDKANKQLHDKADEATDSAQDAKQHAQSILSSLAGLLSSHAAEAGEQASHKVEAVKRDAIKKLPKVQISHIEPEIVVADNTSKWLWLGVGLIAGAAIALLLAPSSGRRSRALIKDKLNKTGHDASHLAQSAAEKATDLSNRASGVAHDAKAKLYGGAEDDVDNGTLTDRVRTALGEHEVTKALPHLNIDSVDGLVTVRGPLLESAQKTAIETVVRAVKGVKEVNVHAPIADAPEDEATFVG